MKTDEHSTILVDLREPVDLRGHMAQRLGTVRRVGFSLDTRRIVMVELETSWQTLKVSGDLIEFDRDLGCWYMKRNRRSAQRAATANRAQSASSSAP